MSIRKIIINFFQLLWQIASKFLILAGLLKLAIYKNGSEHHSLKKRRFFPHFEVNGAADFYISDQSFTNCCYFIRTQTSYKYSFKLCPLSFLPGTSKQSLSTRVGSLLYFTWSQIVKIKVRENIWKTGTFQIHFFHEIRQFFFTDNQVGSPKG